MIFQWQRTKRFFSLTSTKRNLKKTTFPLFSLSWLLGSMGVFLAHFLSSAVWAASGTAYKMSESSSSLGNAALFAIGSSLAISLAAFGGALGQGKLGASAMEGIARNPQAQKDMFVPLMIGMAFIESLVIYAFVISFLIQNKI